MGIARIKTGILTVEVDLDFSGAISVIVPIDIGKSSMEVLRGRLYIDDPIGVIAHSMWATCTFYNNGVAAHGANAFYRTSSKMVYTQLEAGTPLVPDTNVTPDDQTDFSPNDLALIIDPVNGNEYIRLMTIANTMVAEDSIGQHAIDDGLVRVSEFSGFHLYTINSTTVVYLKVSFAAIQTVSLKMELYLNG